MRFTKAHGLGNDFILVPRRRRRRPWAWACACAIATADRRRRCRPPCAHAGRVSFRLVNADGLPARSQATACAASPRSRCERWAPLATS